MTAHGAMTRRGWVVFTILSLLWGLPFFFIKVAVHELAPVFVVWSRLTIGAAVLLPWAWRRGALRGLGARRGAVVAFALVEVTAPYFLIAQGERWISSSVTAILLASVPLAVVLLSPAWVGAAWPSPRRWAGLGLGLAGVVALVGIDIAGRPLEILGAACVLVAALCYAVGPLLAQRHLAGVDPLGIVAAALGVGSVVLAIPAVAAAPSELPSLAAVAAVLGLAVTAMAVVLLLFLVTEVGAARASIVTYVNPAVAVLVGVVILGERSGAVALGGLGLILVGSGLATMPDRGGGPGSDVGLSGKTPEIAGEPSLEKGRTAIPA